jgi:uncharacterized protein (TIGR03437 family)
VLAEPSVTVSHHAKGRQPASARWGLAPGSLVQVLVSDAEDLGWGSEGDFQVKLRAPVQSEARSLQLVEQSKIGWFQCVALLPADIPLGEAEITVTRPDGKAVTDRIWISPSNFGIYRGRAQVWRNGPVKVGLTTPVRTFDILTWWGTGLGAAAPASVSIDVAGVPATIVYAGPAPGRPGVDQINFLMPEGVPDDCYVPATVSVNGQQVDTDALSTSSTLEPCRHRLNLTAEQLRTLDGGGAVPLATASLFETVFPDGADRNRYRRSDRVSLDFIRRGADEVRSLTGLLPTAPPVRGCSAVPSMQTIGLFRLVEAVDAGEVAATTPAGSRMAMSGSWDSFSTAADEREYPVDAIPVSRFAPGMWAVEASGGTSAGRFRVELRVPPPLRWIDRPGASPIARDKDLIVRWDPSGYDPAETLNVALYTEAGGMSCTVLAADGALTIPAPGVAGSGTLSVVLLPVNAKSGLFSVPAWGPGLARYLFSETINLTIQ